MNILLLSAYDAASHQAWRLGLEYYFSGFNWTVLTLQPRYFNWRVRGNSLCWAFGERDRLTRDYDLVIATSVVDISALKGFVPELGGIPTIVYFHENQFAYPAADRQISTLEPCIVNLYSALAADAVVFNSQYNRQTFFDGADALLKKFPDHVPAGLMDILDDKTQVIPVPLFEEVMAVVPEDRSQTIIGPFTDPFTIAWNHRWEYDKGPDRLLACIRALPAELNLRFHVIGQNFRQSPAEFLEIRQLLTERNWLGRWGFIEDKKEYYKLLGQSDAVLSTALHDFQGLAILEGVACGCSPIVPDRLAYREIFTESYRYESVEKNPAREAEACASLIIRMAGNPVRENCAAMVKHEFCWDRLGPRYESLFRQLATK